MIFIYCKIHLVTVLNNLRIFKGTQSLEDNDAEFI